MLYQNTEQVFKFIIMFHYRTVQTKLNVGRVATPYNKTISKGLKSKSKEKGIPFFNNRKFFFISASIVFVCLLYISKLPVNGNGLLLTLSKILLEVVCFSITGDFFSSIVTKCVLSRGLLES